ncbi:hypothetical protein niasHT_031385 [Heterodera trifolii]|uniref:AAA+ ATPase domain-containing protein n=1 Tax=Heterodera trifolii TaxID=157864 RepID=A0ABD2J694_9BILA
MELVMLNPNLSAEVVKKIEDCRGPIERFVNDKSIAEKIVKLLQIRDEISHLIMDRTDTSLEDVAESEAKKILQTVLLPLQYPERFKGFLSPQKSILLVGAQGSQKVMLAKAAANASSAKLFNIPSSVILSKNAEGSADFIKVLFQMAKHAQPSVIFIDEIDILSQRWMKRQAKAQFLVEMDRLSSKSGDFGVFVIGATDRPQEMDEDASGRFAKRIFVEMPDKKAREKMLWKIVKNNENDFELSEKEIDQLALMTENFSFDDLLELCQTANLAIVHNASEQNKFFHGAMDAQFCRIKMKDLENAIEEKQKPKRKQSNGKEKESQIV